MQTRNWVIALTLSVSGVAFADTVVVPTGNPALDVPHLQTAASTGGNILLRAVDASGAPRAFELGNGRVVFLRDVTISGETVGDAMTTLHGGNQPFQARCPFNFATGVCTSPAPRFVVHGLRFDANLYDGIRVLASSYLEITGNQFVNTHGGPFLPTATKGQGIWVGGAGFPDQNISGQIVIADNLFSDVQADLGYGIAMFGFAADTVVRHNTVHGVNTSALGVFFFDGKVTIEDNLLEPGPGVSPVESGGNGVLITQAGRAWLTGTALIQRNVITCTNPNADGIILAYGMHDSVVTQNRISMHGALYSAVTVGLDTQRSYIGQNVITGDGAVGLGVLSAVYEDPSTNKGNTFAGNNITGFTSTAADVYFDAGAIDTTLVGISGHVIDQGTNSHITGFTRMNGSDPVGQALRSAQLERLRLTLDAGDVPDPTE